MDKKAIFCGVKPILSLRVRKQGSNAEVVDRRQVSRMRKNIPVKVLQNKQFIDKSELMSDIVPAIVPN